jgi:hypothetical protein
MVMLLHTTTPGAKVGEWLPIAATLVVCGEDADMAYAGAIGIAAKTRAAITVRLKRTRKSLFVFIRTILL